MSDKPIKIDLKKIEKKLRAKKLDARIEALKEVQNAKAKSASTMLTEVLEETLDPGEWEFKEELLTTLGVLEVKETVPFIIPYLQDKNGMVRESAAYALGMIGDKSAVSNLIATLDDKEYNVREMAANSLAKIGDPRCIDPLLKKAKSSVMEDRLSVIPVLVEFGDNEKTIQALVDALEDEETQVRFPAIIAFNKIKNPLSVEGLIKNLESEDPLLQKVAADALVFNLGWGSIKEGKLTRFGKRRRKILAEELEAQGRQGEFREPELLIDNFDHLENRLISILSLTPKQSFRLELYIGELAKRYDIVKKEEPEEETPSTES
ncbi:MAG: HEAT repeat domain-containing protein [Candidatus Hodarchaeota archaeon]